MFGNDDDDCDLTKYVLQLSKKIAQLTKDYVGLPFSSRPGQLPFSLDVRAAPQSVVYGSKRKWQRGDPLIGFYTANKPGRTKMMLNLPDGSTMLDLCYPGWEVAVLGESAMDFFFARRAVYGDLYGHLLNGKPIVPRARPPPKISDATDALRSEREAAARPTEDDAATRQADLFEKRRTSLQKAAENQQRRGISFNATPETRSVLPSPGPDVPTTNSTISQTIPQPGPKTLQTVKIGSSSTRDAKTGVSQNRLLVIKTYSTGETETIEKSHKGKVNGAVDCDIEQLLASQLFKLSVDASRESSQPDAKDPFGNSAEQANDGDVTRKASD